jgi:haloacetate dehalogenase
VAWFHFQTNREPKPQDFFGPALPAYLDAVRNPETVTAICEDYRAAAGLDLVHDRASREAGQRIACPLLALWGAKGRVGAWYDVPVVWHGYANDLRGAQPVNSGHYLAEEAPGEVLAALAAFL